MGNFLIKICEIICKIFGHKWVRYIDETYEICERCGDKRKRKR